MSHPSASGRRFDPFALGLHQPIWQDVGLTVMAAAGVAAAYLAASDSAVTATVAAIAVSTAAGMHARLAMGRWLGAVQILACGLLLLVLGAAPRLVGVVLVAGFGGAELVARGPRRSAILRVAAGVALISAAASVSGVAATVAVPARAALREGLAAAAGGFLSAPLMLMLGPVAEWLFGHITPLTMREWLSYEYPLLRRLASTAPGTFQHSVNVGVLADAAASAIGADPLLARVGGLYHDVGKLNAPEYFVENQHGPNPHDALDPSESARILRAHVFDGVTMVTARRMGQRVADFIREHHGTGEMRFFREKATALGQHHPEGTFRYPGPSPRSRETGILMIADQLEATARSKPPADDEACDELVRTTIERIEGERQLAGARLTSQDLALARRAFSLALQAMCHHRVTYPPTRTPSTVGIFAVPSRSRRVGR